MEEEERIAKLRNLSPSHRQGHLKGSDHASSPSGEASLDPAATSHSAAHESSIPKSKYEPSEPYRSRKGDRFS